MTQPLHLPRLAAAQSDTWVALPAGDLPFTQSVVRLTRKLKEQKVQAAGEWLLCLSGEAVLDLPEGAWVRLQVGETLRLAGGSVWEALPATGEVVLLRTRTEGWESIVDFPQNALLNF